jgi:Kef-type K+ transport system membrane component KefB/Trk K+ transport system NAD-binding subunit
MHEIAVDLLILLSGIWLVAITLRPLGLPTIMGELIVGVLVGPAVLGWIEPSEAITLLADLGIFFLMFHAGVETQPRQFFDALRRSLGVAVVGALVPFSVAFAVASAFGLPPVGATFVGLTMTATAVVVTLKTLRDLGLADTRVARVIVASCVIDDLLTLVFFGLILGVLSGGSFQAIDVAVTLAKVVAFFALAVVIGRFVYPSLTLPFRAEGGKGFTFVLLVAIAAGLLADAIGLHMILGAYLAGLFFEEKVAHPNLVRVVADRSYGIAYSFLGPIFFISLGFSITFDISASGFAFLGVLTLAVIVGQVISAGGMALRMGLPGFEALTVGVGMCGRAELAFILASLALAQGAIEPAVFSVLIFTAFLLNIFTPVGLKACSTLLAGRAARSASDGSGVVWSDKFGEAAGGSGEERPATSLQGLGDAVVIYGYGPEVVSLVDDLVDRRKPYLIIEEDSEAAQRLNSQGLRVAHVGLSGPDVDLRPLADARALVLNGRDEVGVLLTLAAREAGFDGKIVAMIDDPDRRSALLFAGANVVFAPTHVLAAALTSRASSKMSPLVGGLRPLRELLEIIELRVHEGSPLAGATLAETRLRSNTGVSIIGRWSEGELGPPPKPDENIAAGTILIGAGTPESIERLNDMARPIGQEGTIIVVGSGGVGRKLSEIISGVGERVYRLGPDAADGVDLVGDVRHPDVLRRLPLADARVVVLALGDESSTVLATTLLREKAPDLPIIAGTEFAGSVARIERAGADFALSISQVAGRLLAHHVLGETVSLHSRIKLVRMPAGPLRGKNPLSQRIRERTGCTVVAVDTAEGVEMKIRPDLVLSEQDALYVCGTSAAVARYRELFTTDWS